MNRKALIRADASPRIGAGHVMRTLALGQLLLDDGYEVHFATIPDDVEMADRLRREGFNVYCFEHNPIWRASSDLNELLNLAAQVKPSWVILDGYHFDEAYEQEVKRAGYKLLRIDDMPAGRYHADIVLNQNYGAEEFKYATEPYTQVLAGLRHVLLRREFRKFGQPHRAMRTSPPLHVMVSLGGSSEKTVALNRTIAHGLSGLSDRLTVTILAGTSSRNMAEEMLKADLAVVSGGSIMWELVYMRVPFLAVALTSVQRDYLGSIARKGLCVDLGWHEDLTQELVQRKVLSCMNNCQGRAQIIEKYRAMMDGSGVGKDLLAVLNCSRKNDPICQT